MLRKNKIIILTLFLIIFVFIIIYFLSFFVVEVNNRVAINTYYDKYNEDEYYGMVKISKIKLENVVYQKASEKNNVNQNIFLVNDEKNFIVLAAHSGNSAISYFKNLHLLETGDNVEVIFNNLSRVYQIFKKTKIKKTGKVKLKTFNYPVIVLITCSKTDRNVQDIYYARLVKSTKN